jgi:hypothetical protein
MTNNKMLQFKFDADVSSAKKQIESLTKQLKDLEREQKAFERTGKGADNSAKIKETNAALAAQKKVLEDARTGYQVLTNEMNRSEESAMKLKQGLSGVQQNIIYIARDAPYGLMGVMNNIETLTDSVLRLKTQTQAAGKEMSAFQIISQGIAATLTSPAGLLALVGILALQFGDKLGGAIDKLTGGLLTTLKFQLQEVGKALGFINNRADAFKENLVENFGNRTNLSNIDDAIKAIELLSASRRLDTNARIALKNLLGEAKNYREKLQGQRAQNILLTGIAPDERRAIENRFAIQEGNANRIVNNQERKNALLSIEIARSEELFEFDLKRARLAGDRDKELQLQAEREKELGELARKSIELDNEKSLRAIEVKKQELETIVSITEKAAKDVKNIPFFGGLLGNELFDRAETLRQQMLELDLRERRINQTPTNETAMRSKFLSESLQRRRDFNQSNQKGVSLDQVSAGLRRNADLMISADEIEMQKELVAVESNERAKAEIVKKYALKKIEIQRELLEVQMRLFEGDKARTDALQIEMNRLEAQEIALKKGASSDSNKALEGFLQGLPSAFTSALEQQMQYNSEAARLERERTAESIAEEKTRIDEQKRLREEEYQKSLGDINYLLETNQISQAEANRRTLKAEEKRVKEGEEIRKRETEIARREQALQSENLAAAVAQNVANLAIQFAAQLAINEAQQGRLNLITLPFTIGLITAGAALFSSVLGGLVQRPRTSFAEGRMFPTETNLGGVMVGDGTKAGVPINMEALLNASQLRDFGEAYSERRNAQSAQPAVINVTIQTKLDATKLVEEFEEQKVFYRQLRV